MELFGERLYLRELNPDFDKLDNYLGWLRDVNTNRFIESARQDYSKGELIKYINDKNVSATAILFGIFDCHTSALIGTVKLEPINFEVKTAWVGILIGDSKNHGKGYGYETFDILCEFCNSYLKLNKIYLGVSPGNIPALKLYEKFGFLPYGNERNVMYLDIEDYKSTH
jgi:ribosomal-protein-alanine N-acetyltransferase